MDKLPIETLSEILDYLDMNRLLRCRRVNKKFKYAIDKLRIKNLTVFEHDLEYENFFLTRRSTNSCKLLQTKNPNVFRSPVIKPIVSRLKLLFITYHVNTGDLNMFKQLEQLQINYLELTKHCRLRLSNLRVLCIEELFQQGRVERRLKLDCVKLRSFKCNYGYLNVDFRQPSNITHLGLWSYESEFNLNRFQKSLSHLYLKNATNVDHTIQLKLFPQLKALYFNERLQRDKIAYLLDEKMRLGRCEFKLFHSGIELNSMELVDQLERLETGNPDFATLVANYRLLDDRLPWSRTLPFCDSELIKLIDNVPDSNFYSKFYNIREISINGTIDQRNFIQFLRHYPNLAYLYLQDTLLDQCFFNQLNTLCSRLFYLEILNTTQKSRIQEFDFILNFNLIYLTVSEELPIELIEPMFKRRSGFLLSLLIGKSVFNLKSFGKEFCIETFESTATFEDLIQAVNFLKSIFNAVG